MSTDFGSSLADYRIGRQIGVGGFSTVFEAAPVRAPSRRVALKIVRF
jgi:serine/threonine protein kinase